MSKDKEQKKIKIWNWNAISSIGTIIASLAAIFAIYIGNKQSNKSLDRTDKQIELILQERQILNEENRPLISINKNFVAGLKNIKQFKLSIENIGSRPAYDLTINNIVFSYSENEFKQLDKSDISYSNPVNKNQVVDFFGNIPLVKTDTYYIREIIKYRDPLTNKYSEDKFYFKWTNIIDKDYRNDALYGIDIKTKQILDDWIEKMNKK